MKRVMALFAALALCAQSSSASVIDTTGSWDGSNSVSAFGNPATATYGQTFIAPGGSLQSFTFFLNGFNDGAHLSMQGQVYAWSGPMTGNGGMATGPALASIPISFTDNGTFQAVTVNTGGTPLTTGQQYVMLLTVSNPADYAASTGTVDFGFLPYFTHDPNNGGGGFVFHNNGNNPGLLNTTTWDTFSDIGDLAFRAVFADAVVPEPTTLAAFGLMAGCGGLYLRRRMKTLATA